MKDYIITVVNDNICLERDGARIWFSEERLCRAISAMQADLYKWQLMLDKLCASRKPALAPGAMGENRRGEI